MSDASVSAIDGRAVVRVGGSELLSPITAQAGLAASNAAQSAADAESSEAGAQLAESLAVAAAGTLYPTTAAGIAATAANGFFSVVGDGTNTYVILYQKVNGAAVEKSRYASKAAYEGPGGAALIGYRGRSVDAKMSDVFSIKDFGAIGDGQPHPLSSRYATLASAQQDYPFAVSLKEQIDYCATQKAVNFAEGDGFKRRAVRVPDGRYVIYGGAAGEPVNSIKIPSWITIEGETPHGAIFTQQNQPFAAPFMVNKDPIALINARVRKLSFIGGSHVMKITVSAEQAGMIFEDINAVLQTAGQIESNYLQTTKFADCVFQGGDFGIKVDGVCNANDLNNVRLASHTGPSLRLRGVVGRFLMVGGSMEAGGNNSAAAIDIEGGDAVSFIGVYFENVHKTLLRSRTSTGIDFSGCRFVGVDLGNGLESYRFDVPEDLVSFGSNRWFHLTVGPANMVIAGHNDNLAGRSSSVWSARSQRRGSGASRSRTFGSTITFDALRFSRPTAGALNSLTGTLRVTMQGGTAGGQPAVKVATFLIAAKGIPGSAVVGSFQSGAQLDDSTGFFIQLQETDQSPLGTTLQIVAYGANAAGNSSLAYSFDYTADTSDDANNISVQLP